MAEETPAQFELTDIEVDTVGLVQEPATRQKFFLLKSQEAQPMADELEIEEVETSEVTETPDPPPEPIPDDGFFEKMRTQFEKWGLVKARASKDAIAQAANMLGIDPKEMAKMYGQMMDGGEEGDEEEMMMGRKGSPGKKPGKSQSARKDHTPEESMTQEDLQKATLAAQAAQFDALLAKAKTELEKSYQEKIVALEKQVEDLSKEAGDQRDKREAREFLEKAMTFRSLPIATSELGGMLRQLHKSLSAEDYEKWEATLKATDAQMFAANLFGEKGTARTAEEVLFDEEVEKSAIEKGIPLSEAILKMPVEKQREYLAQVRGGKQ